jgi:hypothetical protein
MEKVFYIVSLQFRQNQFNDVKRKLSTAMQEMWFDATIHVSRIERKAVLQFASYDSLIKPKAENDKML